MRRQGRGRRAPAAAAEISVQRSVRAGSGEYDRLRRTVPVLGRLGPGFGRRAWKPAPRPPDAELDGVRVGGSTGHLAEGGRT